MANSGSRLVLRSLTPSRSAAHYTLMSFDGPTGAAPTRANVLGGRREEILRGRWSKADVYRVHTPDGTIVVKDFAAKSFLVRLLGRFQVSRECAAYGALRGVSGVVTWLGRIDAHALALESVIGTPIRELSRSERRDDLLDRLRAVLEAIHQRGVIHNDLRGQDNTLVRSDGSIVLLDFAGAFVFRPGSFWHRHLFGRLKQVDEAAYLKWKRKLKPGDLTAEEERFLKRFARYRRFWVFNLKGALRQP